LLNLRGDRGTPRYLQGNSEIWQGRLLFRIAPTGEIHEPAREPPAEPMAPNVEEDNPG